MKKVVIPALLLATQATYCNIIFPDLLIAASVVKTFPLILVSLLIEAAVLRYFLKNISFVRSFIVVTVGNTVSFLAGQWLLWAAYIATGIIILPFAYPGPPSLAQTIIGIAEVGLLFFFMLMISFLIEIISIKLLFNYSFKQLWKPLLLGNALTYCLLLITPLRNEALQIVGKYNKSIAAYNVKQSKNAYDRNKKSSKKRYTQ
jgi:hypothetical protein